jgi:predicted RNA-binding Zn-ribbon protein involved in translation (DUF1610 family)
MTVRVARRNRRRTPDLPPQLPLTESIAIGEIDQTVFDCPSCGRPLVLGARRCPSCGTHLVLGVQASKATVLAALGLAVGLLAGGTIGFTVGFGRSIAAGPAAAAVVPSVAPGPAGGGVAASAKPTPTPSSSASIGQVPAISRSALFQALSVNKRLRAGAAALQASLDARAFDASMVAATLRSISGDSVFGQQLAGRLSAWPAAAPLGDDLTTFYDAVHQSAIEGLVATIRNESAYRSAAAEMIGVLNGLPALDAEAQSVAARMGLEIDIAPSATP